MEVGDLVGSMYKFADNVYFTVLKFKACPVQLSYKVAESDKKKMAENLSKLQAHRNSQAETSTPHVTSGGLPPLVNLPDDMEGWTTYDKPILYVYAGKGPFVGRYRDFPSMLGYQNSSDLEIQRLHGISCLSAGRWAN